MIKTRVKWKGGMQFVADKYPEYPISMDALSQYGGKYRGPSPMELLLIALGGCTGMDVIALLKKMQVEISGLEINLKGERRKDYPRVYKTIELKYIVKGENVPEDKIEKAITLSQMKYCSIIAMLKKTCEIKYSYEIIREEFT